MFNVGDRVVDVYNLDEGTVVSRYRSHYIVSWSNNKRGHKLGYAREKYLVKPGSPLLATARQLHYKQEELDKQWESFYNRKKQ